MDSTTDIGTRAAAALRSLVRALQLTHWTPQQSIAEFQHELDEAVALLNEHEGTAA